MNQILESLLAYLAICLGSGFCYWSSWEVAMRNVNHQSWRRELWQSAKPVIVVSVICLALGAILAGFGLNPWIIAVPLAPLGMLLIYGVCCVVRASAEGSLFLLLTIRSDLADCIDSVTEFIRARASRRRAADRS